MLGISGIELQERLQELDISLPVVVMTAYAQIGMTVRAMRAGAVTLLEKPCEENELWDAIRAALAQNAKQRETQSRCRELQQRIDGLSPLHRNIMDWIVAGRSNKWIAEQLELVLRTIVTRRHEMFRQMQADSVAELVRLVIEADTRPRSHVPSSDES